MPEPLETTIFGLHPHLGNSPGEGAYFRYYTDALHKFELARKAGHCNHLSLNIYTANSNITYKKILSKDKTDWPLTAATIKSWSKHA